MDRARRPGIRGCGNTVILMAVMSLACLAAGYIAGRLYTGGSSSSSSAAPSLSTPPRPICTNTCSKAKDGVCDEGRVIPAVVPGSPLKGAVLVQCDLGTDCDDCGPWQPRLKPMWHGHKTGPIATLLSKGIQVRVKEVPNKQLGFKFAYTDDQLDHDVSRYMHLFGAVEPAISKIFYHVFKNGCVGADGKRALFVDVGGNFGWFTVLAARMGCRVLAFEPVPHFRAFLEYSVHLNDLQHLVQVHSTLVSHMPGQRLTMVVPSAGIWGTAGIDGLNIDSSIPGTLENITVASVSLDQAVREDVLLLKVDVEGWEWSVMQGAQALIASHQVEHIILEYSPGIPERTHRYDDIISTVQMLITVTGQQYRLAHLGEGKEPVESYDAPLPKYEEVSPRNLQYDLRDAQLFKEGTMACPAPPELRWTCNSLPEDVSPRSLRSVFGHNTNIWASRNRSLQHLEGTVGLLALDDPEEKFMTSKLHFNFPYGMGMRACMGIQPQYQVRHRCVCSNTSVCGEEEKLAFNLAKAGKLPSNYRLPD